MNTRFLIQVVLVVVLAAITAEAYSQGPSNLLETSPEGTSDVTELASHENFSLEMVENETEEPIIVETEQPNQTLNEPALEPEIETFAETPQPINESVVGAPQADNETWDEGGEKLPELTWTVEEKVFVYGNGLLLFSMGSGGDRFYHQDRQDSIISVTDNSGESVQTANYYPFGEMFTSTTMEKGFLSSEKSISGENYLGVRYFDSMAGRFISPDPEYSENLYIYSLNNPLRYSDMGGRKPKEINVEGGFQEVDERDQYWFTVSQTPASMGIDAFLDLYQFHQELRETRQEVNEYGLMGRQGAVISNAFWRDNFGYSSPGSELSPFNPDFTVSRPSTRELYTFMTSISDRETWEKFWAVAGDRVEFGPPGQGVSIDNVKLDDLEAGKILSLREFFYPNPPTVNQGYTAVFPDHTGVDVQAMDPGPPEEMQMNWEPFE